MNEQPENKIPAPIEAKGVSGTLGFVTVSAIGCILAALAPVLWLFAVSIESMELLIWLVLALIFVAVILGARTLSGVVNAQVVNRGTGISKFLRFRWRTCNDRSGLHHRRDVGESLRGSGSRDAVRQDVRRLPGEDERADRPALSAAALRPDPAWKMIRNMKATCRIGLEGAMAVAQNVMEMV